MHHLFLYKDWQCNCLFSPLISFQLLYNEIDKINSYFPPQLFTSSWQFTSNYLGTSCFAKFHFLYTTIYHPNRHVRNRTIKWIRSRRLLWSWPNCWFKLLSSKQNFLCKTKCSLTRSWLLFHLLNNFENSSITLFNTTKRHPQPYCYRHFHHQVSLKRFYLFV